MQAILVIFMHFSYQLSIFFASFMSLFVRHILWTKPKEGIQGFALTMAYFMEFFALL